MEILLATISLLTDSNMKKLPVKMTPWKKKLLFYMIELPVNKRWLIYFLKLAAKVLLPLKTPLMFIIIKSMTKYWQALVNNPCDINTVLD